MTVRIPLAPGHLPCPLRAVFITLIVACAAGSVQAAECVEEGDVVDDTGVLISGQFPSGCLVFLADSGGTFALDDFGEFVAGDRVAITGTCTTIKQLCEPYNPDGYSSLLEDVTMRRAYADCGAMELTSAGCLAFRGDDGQDFLLESDRGLLEGDRVYASGEIDEAVTRCPEPLRTLLDSVVGPCFESTGRIVPDGSLPSKDALFEQNDGTSYDLESFGLSRVGEFVYVEGILGSSCAMAGHRSCIESNTIEKAFAGCGTIEESEDCGLELASDRSPTGGKLVLSLPGPFAVGDLVYATGRVTGRCTPRPSCSDSCLEVSSIQPCFAERGTLRQGRQGCSVLETGAGQMVAVEHVDGFDSGDEVAIEGSHNTESSLCSALRLDVIEDNLVSRSFVGCGTLRLGFECAPLLEADDGGLFFLENSGGFDFNDRVFVEGQITAPCLPLCPFSCIVDNMISQTPECSGIQ